MSTLQPRSGSEWQGRARVVKALKLARVAEGRITSSDLSALVSQMDDARVADGLRALERAAGVREGSRETWVVVVGILRDREMEDRRRPARRGRAMGQSR